IDALDLARDQTIGDGTEAGAAVLFRKRCTEKAERAHLGHDLALEPLLAIGLEHARKELLLGVATGAVAHHPLVLGQLALEVWRILPVECGGGERRGGRPVALSGSSRHGGPPLQWTFLIGRPVSPCDSARPAVFRQGPRKPGSRQK